MNTMTCLYATKALAVIVHFLKKSFFSQRRLGDAAKKAISKMQVRTIKKGDKVCDVPHSTFHINLNAFLYSNAIGFLNKCMSFHCIIGRWFRIQISENSFHRLLFLFRLCLCYRRLNQTLTTVQFVLKVISLMKS